ncbi:MAG: SWIM zinc finger family protein [Acidobacteria bacterium]|nr:SWIM zinc finger family protein [Acidobacteriota bacterium]
MQFEFRYAGESQVHSGSQQTAMNFIPDALREPTYFKGELANPLAFREAISALNSVVVSDLRMKKKDRSEYLEWAQKRDIEELNQLQSLTPKVQEQLQRVEVELGQLRNKIKTFNIPFLNAQRKYFDYLYKNDRQLWILLDPVISIHPDELFFECFSKDESTYARLACDYQQFQKIGEFACGTTNIDYSHALYREFQKLRSYRTTQLQVDPGGFQVQTEKSDAFTEVKIDLPDSWVRGFLQVSAAMTLPANVFQLHPMDLANICLFLRRHKEKHGPRSLRFQLKPHQPVRLVFEPWNTELVCRRSIYHGPENEVRFWGRRRLLVLERLIPWAKSIQVHLTGTGLPSFFAVDLDGMVFTLGLSGWTANDWSRCGHFSLLSSRIQVDSSTRQRVHAALKKAWFASVTDLSKSLNIDQALVASSLQAYTQAGRVMFDINKGVYRLRELSREPLPLEKLRFSSEAESKATQILDNGQASLGEVRTSEAQTVLKGTVQEKQKIFQVEAIINADLALTKATCQCDFYVRNKLYRGPCPHILALRMAFQRDQRAAVSL